MSESEGPRPQTPARLFWPQVVLLPATTALVIIALGTAVLRSLGRVWWCECGERTLWSGDVWSSHNSQHLFDPYSFSHFSHGIIFYWTLAWLAPRWSVAWRFVVATAIEVGWEVSENTEFVIQRYRESTVSLDYFGDSIGNSLGDVLSFASGFVVAGGIGVWGSGALLLALELLLLVWIRDCLLLNVIMLVAPIDAIKTWQQAGQPAS